MDMTMESCRKFVEVLASDAPAPGGGGAAALVGAIGTALGKLFGSVTNKEVVEEIIKQTGMDLDKKKVSIGDSIKMLGERTAAIKLHPKVTAEVTVKIVEA